MRHVFDIMRRPRIGGVFVRPAAVGILALAAAIVPTFSGFSSAALARPIQETAVAQKKTVHLGPKFVAGRVTVYEQDSSITASNDQFGADNEFQGTISGTTKTSVVLRLRVAEVHEDGGATIEMTYDRYKTQGGGDLAASYSFDSDKDPSEDENPRVGRAFRMVLTTKFIAEVSADGLVQSVTGNEDVVYQIERVDEIRGRANDFRSEQLVQMLQGFWRVGDGERDREEGEKWVEQQEMPLGGLGTLFFISTFDVTEITDETALIDFNLDLVLEVGEEFKLKEGEAQEEGAGSEAGGDEEGDKKADEGDGDNDGGGQAMRQDGGGDDAGGNGQEEEADDQDPGDGGQDEGAGEMETDPQYIPIEDAHVEVKDLPGHFLWDCQRSELIERETALWFELTTVQSGLFQLRLKSVQRNDVKTMLRRIAVE